MRVLRQFLLEAARFEPDPEEFEKVWNLHARTGRGIADIADYYDVTPTDVANFRAKLVRVMDPPGSQNQKYILQPLKRGAHRGTPGQAVIGRSAINQGEMVKAFEELGTYSAVAQRLGVPYPVVRNYLQRLLPGHVAKRGRPRVMDFNEKKFIRLWNASSDIAEFDEHAAEELGVDLGHLHALDRYVRWQQAALKIRNRYRARGFEDPLKKMDPRSRGYKVAQPTQAPGDEVHDFGDAPTEEPGAPSFEDEVPDFGGELPEPDFDDLESP